MRLRSEKQRGEAVRLSPSAAAFGRSLGTDRALPPLSVA
jgi:hypothetical protein